MDANKNHRSKETKRGFGRNDDVSSLGNRLLVANDSDVLVEKLPPIEKLIVVDHPIPQVMRLLKNARGAGVSEVELAGRDKPTRLVLIPVASEDGGDGGEIGPPLSALNRAG